MYVDGVHASDAGYRFEQASCFSVLPPCVESGGEVTAVILAGEAG